MNLARACVVGAIGTAFACGAPGQGAKKGTSGAITDHVPTELAEPPSANVTRPAAPARKAKAPARKAKRPARRAKAKDQARVTSPQPPPSEGPGR